METDTLIFKFYLTIIVIALAGIFLTVILIARYRHKERMGLIEKGINPLIIAPSNRSGRTLFWGLILSGAGLAGIINVMLQPPSDVKIPFFIFTMAFFCGIAILIYRRLNASQRKAEKLSHEGDISQTETNDSKEDVLNSSENEQGV